MPGKDPFTGRDILFPTFVAGDRPVVDVAQVCAEVDLSIEVAWVTAADGTATVDAPEGGSADAPPPPVNQPTGTYDGNPLKPTETVLYLRRSAAPDRPRVFFSTSTVACGDLKAEGWQERVERGVFYLYLDTRMATPGTYSVASNDARFARGITWSPPGPTQGASEGTVTLSMVGGTSAAGSFSARFVRSDGSLEDIVGVFDAPVCDIDG